MIRAELIAHPAATLLAMAAAATLFLRWFLRD